MKRSRFTEEQIIAILREQEAGMKTADVCRKHGISEATFYKYKAKFGGMDVSDARRLKALEDENAKLKKLACRADAGQCEPHFGFSGSFGSSPPMITCRPVDCPHHQDFPAIISRLWLPGPRRRARAPVPLPQTSLMLRGYPAHRPAIDRLPCTTGPAAVGRAGRARFR